MLKAPAGECTDSEMSLPCNAHTQCSYVADMFGILHLTQKSQDSCLAHCRRDSVNAICKTKLGTVLASIQASAEGNHCCCADCDADFSQGGEEFMGRWHVEAKERAYSGLQQFLVNDFVILQVIHLQGSLEEGSTGKGSRLHHRFSIIFAPFPSSSLVLPASASRNIHVLQTPFVDFYRDRPFPLSLTSQRLT